MVPLDTPNSCWLTTTTTRTTTRPMNGLFPLPPKRLGRRLSTAHVPPVVSRPIWIATFEAIAIPRRAVPVYQPWGIQSTMKPSRPKTRKTFCGNKSWRPKPLPVNGNRLYRISLPVLSLIPLWLSEIFGLPRIASQSMEPLVRSLKSTLSWTRPILIPLREF